MKKISRRQFLRVSAVAGAGAVLAACSTPAPQAPAATAVPAQEATAVPAATQSLRLQIPPRCPLKHRCGLVRMLPAIAP
jgi:hypothetical protein